MRYELFLRGERPLSGEAVSLGEAATSDLRVERYEAADNELLGLDLSAPLDGTVEPLCKTAFSLAEQHGLAIFDPQLGRTVTRTDHDAINAAFSRCCAFHQGMPLSTPTRGVASVGRSRLWLYLGGTALTLVLGLRAISCLY